MGLKQTNLSGQNPLISPSGQIADAKNFIDPYTYAQQFQPELLPEMHLKHGKGKITKFCAIISNGDRAYASDQVKHSEMGRLHRVSEDVTVGADNKTFTCPKPHNLRENEIIMISDGKIERQATITAVISPTVFEAANNESGSFGLTGTVSLFAFSNSWNKGDGNFNKGKEWIPEYVTNYSHIIKEYYELNRSDLAHIHWVQAPMYPGKEGWYSVDTNRTGDLFDNEVEMTQLFHKRLDANSPAVLAGKPRGMNGLVPQVEQRGNIFSEYIKTKADLEAIAFMLKQQGGVRSATIWADHQQMVYLNDIAASINAAYNGGANYGLFNNSKNMAIALDFKSIYIAGVTFHFTPLSILDDPSLLGASKFKNTSIGFIIVPAGEMMMNEEGNSYSVPFFSVRTRQKGAVNRRREVEFFGRPFGTPILEDKMKISYLTEQTNQLVGANNFFVGRRGTGIYGA